MAKKKLFKDDGTEDFDAESKELDDAAAPGLIGEDTDSASKADALGTDSGKGDAAATAPTDSSASTTGGDSSADKAAPASSDASASSASAPAATSESSAPSAPASDASAEAPAEPEPFGELHGEVTQLADHLEGDAIDALKDAGNKLTPAVSKLKGIEAKFEKMGDELKNRLQHAKTELVNAMGALEMIFKRGK